jgi:hypothetical protein
MPRVSALAELEAIVSAARASVGLDANAQAEVVSQGLSVLAASGLMTDELYALQDAAVSMDVDKFQAQFAEVGALSFAAGAAAAPAAATSLPSSLPTPTSTTTSTTTTSFSSHPSSPPPSHDSYVFLSSPHFCAPPSPNLASSSILSPSSLPPLFTPPPLFARATDDQSFPPASVAIPMNERSGSDAMMMIPNVMIPSAVARAFFALFPFSPVCPNSSVPAKRNEELAQDQDEDEDQLRRDLKFKSASDPLSRPCEALDASWSPFVAAKEGYLPGAEEYDEEDEEEQDQVVKGSRGWRMAMFGQEDDDEGAEDEDDGRSFFDAERL